MAYTAIDDAGLFFNTVLYTGTGSSNAVTGVGFQPDFTWIKSRSNAYAQGLTDSVRGVKETLFSNTNGAEVTYDYGLTAFGADGFTVISDNIFNASGPTYASWNWKAGTTSGITTNGSTTITPSSYSFNQTSGFSVLKYTGNSTSGAGLAHGLGVKPGFLIMKKTNSAGDNWQIYHQSVGYSNSGDLALNTTSGQGAQTNFSGEPDATNIFLGGNTINNGNTDTFICYAFADIKGYSKFSSYTGNNNVDGPFIFTGFQPAWVCFKRYDSGENWSLYDNKRGPRNVISLGLRPNQALVESAYGTTHTVDFLSNGFKIREAGTNINNGDYIYMAFGSNSFVNSEGVPGNSR